jgi:hypothetical protein
MNATGPDEVIASADLSANGHLDLIATFAKSWSTPPNTTADLGYLLVLHNTDGLWTSHVFSKPDNPNQATAFTHPSLINATNLIKAKYPQIIFTELRCTSISCATVVHIVSWYDNKWVDLTPVVPQMENVDKISFADKDSNGMLALVLSGGLTKAPDAGPQRRRTEVYSYNPTSAAFQLSDTSYEASAYLYFKVLNGNDALLHQNYDYALGYYTDAVNNNGLKLWSQEQGASQDQVLAEHEVLVAFARFRLGITYLLKGDRQKASDTFALGLSQDGDYKGWIEAFIGPYQAHPETATIVAACAAATLYSQQHPELIAPLNKFGYNNPLFKPEDICPPLN